jgi:F0F1-type ATP synthase assembly protein I
LPPEPKHPETSGLGAALSDAGPYLGIGTSLAATLLICLGAGWWLDQRYGTSPAWFMAGAVIGLLAACYHFYRMYKHMTDRKK